MQNVTKKHRSQWGSYKDRKNSFDDSKDIYRFAELVNQYSSVRNYIRSYIGGGDCGWVEKPDGDYGVDLALYRNGVRSANFDIERWSQWKSEWPHYYNYLQFLGRKEKFLGKEVPFFMCFMNFNRDRFALVDEKTIRSYPTIEKEFVHKNVKDRVKEISMSDGYIFGNYSDHESELFKLME